MTRGGEAATIWVAPDELELDDGGEEELEDLLDSLLGPHVDEVLDKLVELDDTHPDQSHWYLGAHRDAPGARGPHSAPTC